MRLGPNVFFNGYSSQLLNILHPLLPPFLNHLLQVVCHVPLEALLGLLDLRLLVVPLKFLLDLLLSHPLLLLHLNGDFSFYLNPY
jgi:hypothetical protein